MVVEGLHAAHVVVGGNFRFGARASGDVAFLTEAGRSQDFEVEGVALDGGPQVWSSTYVRTCLAAGDVEGAAEALGRPYAVIGNVVRGDQRGRELGYPTANVPTQGRAVPADGVYAGWLRRLDEPGSEPLPAAISVGTNPTFDGERERRVEAYVLDRTDLDLYDEPVEVSFVARIRGMVRFDGVEALVETMAQDVEHTRGCSAGERATIDSAPEPSPTSPRRRSVPAPAPRPSSGSSTTACRGSSRSVARRPAGRCTAGTRWPGCGDRGARPGVLGVAAGPASPTRPASRRPP